MNEKDRYRLQRIADIGSLLLADVAEMGITKDSLSSNHRLQWLVTTPLYDIGEQANCLSQEIVDAYPALPWTGVAGLRHRLVHDYEGTNWDLVGIILFDELEDFVSAVKDILDEA